MKIFTQYDIGQIVYLKTDPEQLKRIITRIMISPEGVGYQLAHGSDASEHYDIEISRDQDELLRVM